MRFRKTSKFAVSFVLTLLLILFASCAQYFIGEVEIIINDNQNRRLESHRSHLYGRVPHLSGLQLQTLTVRNRFNVRFSHNEHFYTEDIYLEITTDVEDAVIYFTTNGAYPVRGLTSQHNRRYTEPIPIRAGNVNTPTVITARAFLSDDVYSDIRTHTYFVSADIHERFDPNTYVFLITSDPVHLFDHDRGILVPGRLREEFVQANPGRNIVPPDPANFNVRGMEGERPAYLQVLNARGELLISQSIGIRVRGGWSRAASRRSLGLYARSKYDPIFDRFYYDFFRFFDDFGRTTIRGTDIPVDSHRMIVLRNGGNDRNGAHIREELGLTLAKQAGLLDYKNVAPAARFINGVYDGFFWLQNMFPVYYFFDNYGVVPRHQIEQLYWFEEPSSSGVTTNDEAFLAYSELVCLYNYMKYFALQIYGGNRDWPHNNLRFWRFTGEGGETVNRYYDGMFRMVPYDFEMAWGMYGQNARERTISRVQNSLQSFGNLTRRPDMAEKFCNQMFDLINTVFRPENVLMVLYRLIDLQDHEIHVAMRSNASSTNRRQLERERESIVRFAENRAEHVIDDMRRTFRLDGAIYYVRVTGRDGASVRLNTLSLNGAGTIESSYFIEHSVKLSADAPNFSHWIINGVRYDTPELMLNADMASGGHIAAEVFLR